MLQLASIIKSSAVITQSRNLITKPSDIPASGLSCLSLGSLPTLSMTLVNNDTRVLKNFVIFYYFIMINKLLPYYLEKWEPNLCLFSKKKSKIILLVKKSRKALILYLKKIYFLIFVTKIRKTPSFSRVPIFEVIR